jgi:hypothetical protein
MEARPRRSFTVDYKRSSRFGRFERPLDRLHRRSLGLRDFCGAGWNNVVWAGADGNGAVRHNAGDSAFGGPRGGDRSLAVRPHLEAMMPPNRVSGSAAHFRLRPAAAGR